MELPIPLTRAAAEAKGVGPPTVHWIEFDTNDRAQREAFFRWLANPLRYMAADGSPGKEDDPEVARELAGLRIPGMTMRWTVRTTLVNHHLGLNPRINLAKVTAYPDGEHAEVEVSKQTDV
jgi:hypothetical protein